MRADDGRRARRCGGSRKQRLGFGQRRDESGASRLVERAQPVQFERDAKGALTGVTLADGRTVPQADYIAVDIVYPDRTGEIYQNGYSKGQRWYYFSNMKRNEALLLKCFDSATDGRTRYTAHSGFQNPHAPAGTPPRESIEVRTLVFF